MSDRKRYALVGTGQRAEIFINALASTHRDEAELVALCDSNPIRMDFYNTRLSNEFSHPKVPTFTAKDFDLMIQKTKPDTVIVVTMDSTHHEYITRSLRLGCDVITEKPIATTAADCQSILNALEESSGRVRVAFNGRWSPGSRLVRRLLLDGVIGEILHIDMEYRLDARHGADYYRRWHRDKSKSGGLMVHKSTHHFDLVNWWLDAVPREVFGFGRLAFYGDANARRRGVAVPYDRYTGHDTSGDPFAFPLEQDERLRGLFLEAEAADGYVRDRNVFSPGITIEDSMCVLVRYATGALLNYSMNTYLPKEGMHVAMNGTGGRLEYEFNFEASAAKVGEIRKLTRKCRVLPLFGEPYEVAVPESPGEHGGADPLLLQALFSSNPPLNHLESEAGCEQGIASALVGIAANHSFASGQPVSFSSLNRRIASHRHLHELDAPGFQSSAPANMALQLTPAAASTST